MRFLLPVFLTILLFPALATAQPSGIAGKWTADTYMSASGDSTPMATIFTFAVDGEKLTGTISSDAGTFDVQEGRIDGDTITFTIEVTGGGKMFYDGRVIGEGLDFIVKVEGRDRSDHFVAKRP